MDEELEEELSLEHTVWDEKEGSLSDPRKTLKPSQEVSYTALTGPSIRHMQKHSGKPINAVTKIGNRGIHQCLGENQILNLKRVFFKQEDKALNPAMLREALEEYGRITFEDEQFELTFLRINIKRDGWVTWDEFISHLILGFKIQEVCAEVKALDDPINKKPKICKSNHRHPINCIIFHFQVKPDRSYSYTDGSYVTLSRDGVINYWSLDFHRERTVQSKSPDLVVADTWVIRIVALPDVSVMCTSSSERDLRFYDTSAKKFELRVQFNALEYAVCSMCYVFAKDPNEDCKLILGDMGGHVRVILFSPINRGPFRSKMGIPLLTVSYEDVQSGKVDGFRVVEFRDLHQDWVRQVEYYYLMNFIVSCSTTYKSLVMRDIGASRGIHTYCVPRGSWCFALADEIPLMATGGPDCLVRVWNPYVTKRPLVVFHGHHTGVVAMTMQDKGSVLCTLSEDKCIKVWDVPGQKCMQTFLGLGNELGDNPELPMFYNPDSRQLVIGGNAIVVLSLRPLQKGEHTDGSTHSAGISVMLYNPLFNIVITCGLDSFIIVWDPWSGKRISVVRDAHTRTLHGETIPVDITAGTFDPGYQLLLTGAHDGSLKTWNFNTGTCIRNMRIEHGCEVTGVCWVRGRILAVGWNKHVTEFADSGEAAAPGGAFSKHWATKHTDDVLCAAVRVPQTLATSTYNGELVLWRLETGQPYKQYAVENPNLRVKITYDFKKRTRHEKPKVTALSKKFGLKADLKKASHAAPIAKPYAHSSKKKVDKGRTHGEAKQKEAIEFAMKLTRKAKPLMLPPTICPVRGLAVRCMAFLKRRPMRVDVGTLFVALENGDVQVWSHHLSGGFLGAFQAVHTVGDYVVSMCSDEKNEYLFTGSTAGYVKTFLMADYFSGKSETICMPKYRLKFPFLWYRFFPGRALHALGDQLRPMLLNSYKAHRGIVSCMTYIDRPTILVTSSVDFSARLWSVGGRYLGTLGTFKPWIPIDPDIPVGEVKRQYTIPPDISRVMSSTTQRVLLAEDWEKKLTKKQEAEKAEKENVYKTASKNVYGTDLAAPILGHFVKLPEKTTHKFEVNLDTSFTYIPVYQHLIRPPPVPLPKITPFETGKIPQPPRDDAGADANMFLKPSFF